MVLHLRSPGPGRVRDLPVVLFGSVDGFVAVWGVSPAVWLLIPWGLWVQSSDVFYFCSYDDSVGAYSGLALWAVLALRHT